MTLEELLNKLIEKGWKPFWITCTDFIKGTGLEWIPSYCFNPHPHMWFAWWTRKYHRPSLRQIVSKESWLWQFVCENGMAKDVSPQILMWQRVADKELSKFIWYNYYEYRLIESALCDENKLEEFLLNSIKLD